MEENREYKKKLRQFWCRLKVEAGLRAVSLGLVAGLFCATVVLLYGRVTQQKVLLIEAGAVGAVFCVGTALLVYIIRFRPRKKEVLARIDALGLQERIITMEELKKEETVIAKRQRQDAKEHLAGLDIGNLSVKVYIKPLLWVLGLSIVVVLLVLLPFPKPEADEQAEQNALELQLVDELIMALRGIIEDSEVTAADKAKLNEIVDALAMSFTEDDTTLSRTAKIATASKRLDMLAAAAESKEMEATVKLMKDLMGTSIDVLNKVEGTFWTPGGPSSGTSYDVEPLPFEEPETEGEQTGEGEEPPEGMEPGEGGEPQEGENGEMNGAGTAEIFDPEQGVVGYGTVYEEYYREILKALTETELSEEIRELIEDYANSLE